MKPHRHSEIIKEFIYGKKCEYYIPYDNKWEDINFLADFDTRHTVRVKPEPKPDVVEYYYADSFNRLHLMNIDNGPDLKLTFDGETGLIKSAEVIK